MSTESGSDSPMLRVGCAMWAHPAWRGRFFPAGPAELTVYETWCTTVEGNTTFYATPPRETVSKWQRETSPDFRFCFKLPRTITHDRRLRDAASELTDFLSILSPMEERLGPVQIQLPASFGPGDLPVLTDFIQHLPADYEWAVEVRHRAFSAGGDAERPLNDLLAQHAVNRVILDSRALFDLHPESREEREAWEQKPRLPVRPVATADQPLLRLIGNRDLDLSLDRWQPWIPKLLDWLEAGVRPHVFTYTPDNVEAPTLARRFWELVNEAHTKHTGVGLVQLPEPITVDTQLDLWGDDTAS